MNAQDLSRLWGIGPAKLYPDGSAADLWKNDGHVNITREGKKEMNEPEGNVGDQSLAMPKSNTQPEQNRVADKSAAIGPC